MSPNTEDNKINKKPKENKNREKVDKTNKYHSKQKITQNLSQLKKSNRNSLKVRHFNK